MDKKSLKRVSDYVYREFGIRIQEGKSYTLEAKLDKLLHREGYGSAEEFLEALNSGSPGARETLSRYVTTGHTYFFREKDHFDFLARAVKERAKANTMIWCAASSSGEEAYSIAISLMDAGFEDFRIVASDLNPAVLSLFSEGLYRPECFRETPASLQRRYFTKVRGDAMKPIPELREKISIKRLNIMDDFRFPRPFEHVFCRNMLIYFDQRSRGRALSRLIQNLAPGGFLFLGHTEAILDPPRGITREWNAVYRRTDGP